MATNIYFVRHGEVQNPKKIIYGRLPGFKLSEKGILQLKKTAEFLKGKKIQSIYSSPMSRAKESAQIIQNVIGIPQICILPELNETDTYLEGQVEEGLDILNLDYYSPSVLKDTNESMEQIADRMKTAIKRIIDDQNGKSAVAVSHGDPIMILRAYLQNLPMKIGSIRVEPYIKHGEVVRLQMIKDNPISIESVFVPEV